jgi:hypothetical protein
VQQPQGERAQRPGSHAPARMSERVAAKSHGERRLTFRSSGSIRGSQSGRRRGRTHGTQPGGHVALRGGISGSLTGDACASASASLRPPRDACARPSATGPARRPGHMTRAPPSELALVILLLVSDSAADTLVVTAIVTSSGDDMNGRPSWMEAAGSGGAASRNVMPPRGVAVLTLNAGGGGIEAPPSTPVLSSAGVGRCTHAQ